MEKSGSHLVRFKKGFVLAFAFVLIFSATSLSAQKASVVKVKISITASDKAKFQHFMSDKNIGDKIVYKSPDLDSSPVVDTLLIYKALVLGGLHATLDFVDIPNSERERIMVISGAVVIAGTSQWDFFADENKETLYKSDTVVPDGAFEKGLYTTKEKLSSIVIKSAKDLAKISCSSTSNWRVDWKTLQGLGFKILQDSPTRETMFKLVEGGRVDTTLQSFSGTPDMSIVESGVTLYPIEGVKVLLSGTRHFVVSKVNPDGKAVFEALQRGLAILKKSNEINRALTETGFFNEKTKTWKAIGM